MVLEKIYMKDIRPFINIIYNAMFLIMIIIVFIPGHGLAQVKITGGKGIAIVKRINNSSYLVVSVIKQGVFYENDLVDIYSEDGNKITSSYVRSIYPDEIYITVDNINVNVIRPGFIIFKGYTSEEIENIFSGSEYNKSRDTIEHIRQQAHSLVVNNPSFEDDVPDKTWDLYTWPQGPCNNLRISGWNVTGNTGNHRPVLALTYPDGIPDGVNYAYSNHGEITQVLDHKLVDGKIYTLKVRVGCRLDLKFGRYAIQLYAGDNLLAEEKSLHPERGEWLTSEVIYKSPPGDKNAGSSLKIVMRTYGVQVNYDMVEIFESSGNDVDGAR